MGDKFPAVIPDKMNEIRFLQRRLKISDANGAKNFYWILPLDIRSQIDIIQNILGKLLPETLHISKRPGNRLGRTAQLLGKPSNGHSAVSLPYQKLESRL